MKQQQAATATLIQETAGVWQEGGRLIQMAARQTQPAVKGPCMRQPVMRSAGGERLLFMRSSAR
ncbi:hypothetical protein JQN58_16575 [Aneurinibacillus sp. BA2021]|nr:hypothetical protein [Aneurinibacillus sp. BA2021]